MEEIAEFTMTDNIDRGFTGKKHYEGYWHTCRVQDLENTGSLVMYTTFPAQSGNFYFNFIK